MADTTPVHLQEHKGRCTGSNEVGFIHPSQFLALAEEAGTLASSSLETIAQPEDECVNKKLSGGNPSDMVFWNRDHKLGISTNYFLPLYKAAKYAFMAAVGQYNDIKLSGYQEESGEENVSGRSSSFQNFCAVEVMKHSRALLLLSSDFGTAWNYRKLMISKEPHVFTFMDELGFSKLVLSYSPKSECAWSHRRWVIKMISGKCLNLPEIVEKESDLVKLIAEKSKMNYRAWNHRCWLVSYMSSEQGPRSCELAVDTITNIIAFGMVFDGGELSKLIHGVPLHPGHFRVSVDGIIQPDALVHVSVVGEIEKVSEAVGSHIAWPRELVNFHTVVKWGPKSRKCYTFEELDEVRMETLKFIEDKIY